MKSADFNIKQGYRPNLSPAYYLDAPSDYSYQPDVYALAGFLAERSEVSTIVDIGGGNGLKMQELAQRFPVVTIDFGANREIIAQNIPQATFIEANLEAGLPDLSMIDSKNSLVIMSDVIEHITDPSRLLQDLANLSHSCRWLLLSTPDRLRCRGAGDFGPPANPCHVREWTLDELDALLRDCRFAPFAAGYTVNTDHHRQKTGILALSGSGMYRTGTMPVRVLAIVHCYNERDIVAEVVEHLLAQEVDVQLVDNWSSDGSWELAQNLVAANPRRVTAKRFPDQPSDIYEWGKQLAYTAQAAADSHYDWIMHYDADELRESPWPGVSLAAALAFVDSQGYNAVDFTVIDFRPVRPDPQLNCPLQDRLPFFEFGRRPGHFAQIKAWKNQQGVAVELAASGGHRADFFGRRVFPLKFLNRHYPLRSQEQARQKVFRDRLLRFSAEERQQKGWHSQYDQYDKETAFVWEAHKLDGSFHPRFFASEYIVERLSGIGLIPRQK
jgi:glycosyltransferase involved in cell wall biosynthesis